MAEADNFRSLKAGSTSGHRPGGLQNKTDNMHTKDSGEVLQTALATVLRAFPTLLHELCDDCQQLLKSLLASLDAGGATCSCAHEGSSFPSSYDVSCGQSWSMSTVAREPPAVSGKEAFDDTSSSSGESISNSFNRIGRSAGKDNEWVALSMNRKPIYHANGKEQRKESANEWTSGPRMHVVTNTRHSQNTLKTVVSYKNALTKAESSTLSVPAGLPQYYSKDSSSSDIPQTPHTNNYVSTASSSYSASFPIPTDENNHELQNMRREDKAEQSDQMCFQRINRKKDFKCLERVNGRLINTAEGLELHTAVFTLSEQKQLVDFVLGLQKLGRNNKLLGRTYSEPRKWMPGKGRVTIQFGCCYNYAVDKQGNLPGIIRDETVESLPRLIKSIIRRMVRCHVLPPTCVPDSCIINIYEEGDCIPPHIDHHDFVRPFCTLSLLSECNIVFGSNLKILAPGEFQGLLTIPLPIGSVLVLKGNGADIAKHAVPAVPTKRISITFRKMDSQKIPHGFMPDKDLQGIVAI